MFEVIKFVSTETFSKLIVVSIQLKHSDDLFIYRPRG